VENRIHIGDEPLEKALRPFLSEYASMEERVHAVQAALESEAGKFWREELGKWTVRMVPV